MRRTDFLLAAGLLCGCAFAAVVKPDFSGTWKLNNAKSKQDGPADRVYLMVVEQQGPNIKVTTQAEGVTNIFDGAFLANGKVHIVKMGNKYRYTTVSFENTTLVFDIIDKDGKKDTSKAIMEVKDSWTLSPDGKVLTRFRQIGIVATPTVPGKVVDQKYVFDKQ